MKLSDSKLALSNKRPYIVTRVAEFTTKNINYKTETDSTAAANTWYNHSRQQASQKMPLPWHAHTRIWYKYTENHSVKHESLHKRYNAVKLAHKQLFSEQPSSCKKTFDHTGRSNSSHLWCSHSIVEGGPIKSDVRITWITNILICSWTRALLL